MASYSTTATLLTNLWMDGWMDNILPIRIRTEDRESVLHYWRCVRLCRWNKLPNPNLLISNALARLLDTRLSHPHDRHLGFLFGHVT
jgi:hypothetical protein